VRTGGLGVGIGSIGLGEVKGVEIPGASGPNFTAVIVPQASPSNFGSGGCGIGCWWQRWIKWQIGGGVSSGSSAGTGSFAFSLHLEVVAILATIILQASHRQGLSNVGLLRTASCWQSI
jgi:hypothetical protein